MAAERTAALPRGPPIYPCQPAPTPGKCLSPLCTIAEGSDREHPRCACPSSVCRSPERRRPTARDPVQGLVGFAFPNWWALDLSQTRGRWSIDRLRSVAQPGSALASGARGRRFESSRSDQIYRCLRPVMAHFLRQAAAAAGRFSGSLDPMNSTSVASAAP